MAHQTFKIKPGVDVIETPVLNVAGISSCQFIRFRHDQQGLGMVEKLGGWKNFMLDGSAMPAITRALWAWEDLDNDAFLAIGMESTPPTGDPPTTGARLAIVQAVEDPATGDHSGQSYTEITPLFLTSNITVDFGTTSGQSLVTITDSTAPALSVGDIVYIAVPVAVGGLVLFGTYAIKEIVSLGVYKIQALNILGQPMLATATVTHGGVVPAITTTNLSARASVALPAHGYQAGQVFPVLVSTTIGGVTFYGNYDIVSVEDADHFTIQLPNAATSNATASLNTGKVRINYNVGGPSRSSATGYGIGGYGAGGYGTGATVAINPGSAPNAVDWALDNWGETLLASPEKAYIGGVPMSGIYAWTPDTGQNQVQMLPNAPVANDGFFVAMPQRQIICWGSTFSGVQDPLLVRWCDVNDYNTWVGTITNQAGSYRLSKGSRIVGGLQTAQQALLWTDLAVWSMQYISQPYIYSFNEVSDGCGLLAQKACGSMHGVTYWMSQSRFYKLDAGGVQPLNCPVWDIVFQDLDLANADKIRCATNSRFAEVAWHYPSKSGGTGDNDSYVKYNALIGCWDYGKITRSAWINQSVAGPPIGACPRTLKLQQHETSPDSDGAPLISWFTTGFFSLSDADVKTFVDEVWPDMKWGYYGKQQSAQVRLTFGVTDFPGQPVYNIGPFTLTQDTTYISPRVRGRLMQITIGSTDMGSFWRIGGLRYRGAPDGRY